MLKKFFLFLSKQKWISNFLVKTPFLNRLAERFVAGENLEEALKVVADLNAQGFLVTLDHLGEGVASTKDAVKAAHEYVRALEEIKRHGLKATVSVKLTHLGLGLGDEPELSEIIAREILETLVREAQRAGTSVEIDMESSAYTAKTLEIFHDLWKNHKNLRVCIQAYLRRTLVDAARLDRVRAPIRLCKGAYAEPPEVAYPEKTRVEKNFRKIMELFLCRRASWDEGGDLAIASWDEKIINATKEYAAFLHLPKDTFEFQLLYGVREELARELLAEAYRVRIYVPYGEFWYPYFCRRLAEHPAYGWLIVQGLLNK